MKTRTTVVIALVSLGLGIGTGAAVAGVNQPHMQAALVALRSARSELQAALPDKGGHRVKAIAQVNGAIAEVEAGMVIGDHH